MAHTLPNTDDKMELTGGWASLLKFSGIVWLTVWVCLAPQSAAAIDQRTIPLTDVSLQLKWTHQFQFAGYLMARHLGYYTDVGLNVEIREATTGQKPMQEVTEGRAHFGVGNTDLLLMHNNGIPVVVLATIFQHSPVALLVRDDQNVANIHQLAERPLMIEPHSSELMAYFSKEGINTDALNFVEHSFDTRELIDNEVGAMSAYITDEPYEMAKANIAYKLFTPISSGIDFYGDNLFTMQNTLEQNPELVLGFLEATKKGWAYAFNNVEETVDVILKEYNATKSREHLLFEAERTKILVMPDVVEVGYMNPARWEQIARTYAELGLISKKQDISKFLYNPNPDLLPSWTWQALGAILMGALATFSLVAYLIRINRKLRSSQRQLIELNQHKELLLSIISHDLKNPIYAVRNFGNMFAEQAQTISRDKIGEYGRLISFGIDTAMGILDNLQQWFVLQSKSNITNNIRVELAPIIQRNIELFRLQAESHNITISVQDFNGVAVLGNEWRIDTVIRNLISNAYKNAPQGSLIDLHGVSNKDYFEIMVEDTGPGMSVETFKIFQTPDAEALEKAKEKGSGFGLPLCKQLVQAQDGELIFENRKEGGLRAIIRLKHG
ncbi:MAG: ABC transporter substrate-binding protein [Magnetovibrio sp.]|nr:ABC transporter substrate-binding protein [Magnetovibrio sp.]